MPSRKAASSEAASSSPKSSLRRLSSLASFPVLNHFSRRRSNHGIEGNPTVASSALITTSTTTDNSSATASTASFSSNLTFASTSANPPNFQPRRVPDIVNVPPVPISDVLVSSKSSTAGIPKSRTFSNLPLPSRTNRNPRLPPPTRLPSPATSTRRHSHSRLHSIESNFTLIGNGGGKKSDLRCSPSAAAKGKNGHIPRSTAFKENISLSPVKLLPPTAYSPKDASSTVFRSSRNRPPTPGALPPQPMQKWSSQPVLINTSNSRTFQHPEVQQTRLMSEWYPPTPAPPKTPSFPHVFTERKPRHNQPDHARNISPPTPSRPFQLSHSHSHSGFISSYTSSPLSPSAQEVCIPEHWPLLPNHKLTSQSITKSELPTYWCGRFSALNDRYRNEDLAAYLHASRPQSDKMHSAEANTKRMRRALEHLYGLCATREARDSFVVFQLQFAAGQNNPELSRPIEASVVDQQLDGESKVNLSASVGSVLTSSSERRKRSLVSRLLGRSRKGLV